jgi:hypothetical protein
VSDVFVSYKREDELRVLRLVRALEKQGLSVWWDRGLPGAEPWRDQIEAALAAARCVVVVWTERSTGPQGAFVKDEAARGAARQVLVPVLLDKVAPPLGFGGLQAIDLSRWRGSSRDAFFQDLVAAVRAKMEGRPVPTPRGPLQRLLRRWTARGVVSALTLAGGAFATNTLNLQNQVCGLAWLQPGVSDACGALSLGGRPARAERLAWAQRPPGSCEGLRTHLQRFPDGAYLAQAHALLSARTVSTVESWHPGQRLLSLSDGGGDAPGARTEGEARQAALQRGQLQAERACQDFAVTGGLFRYQRAEVQVQQWHCSSLRSGPVCGFEGRAVCFLDERQVLEQERCDPAPEPAQP